MSTLLLRKVMRAMEKIAPLSLAETSWDNVGLLIEAPFPREGANRVMLTIDLTSAVLEECLNDHPNVGIIVAYHPPIFRPLKALTMREEKQRIAALCAATGISVYSPHTALDNAVGGMNDWLARGLGDGKTTPIKASPIQLEGQEGAGSGRLHVLNEPVSISTLILRVKQLLGLQYVRFAAAASASSSSSVSEPSSKSAGQSNYPVDTQDVLVGTIGICAGSGGSVLAGIAADVVLTGEMSHHEVLAMQAAGTSVILCEHSNSERGYLSNVLQYRLQSLLRVDSLDSEADVTVQVICSSKDREPLQIV